MPASSFKKNELRPGSSRSPKLVIGHGNQMNELLKSQSTTSNPSLGAETTSWGGRHVYLAKAGGICAFEPTGGRQTIPRLGDSFIVS